VLGRRQVKLAVQNAVAGADLVHVGSAVADPLAGYEDRQLYVVLDLAHLERRAVAVAHEVADQARVFTDAPCAAAVADPGGLHHGRVVAHVVHDADEAVI